MKVYAIKFLDSDGEIESQSHEFQVENSATVSALKEAFQKEVEMYKPDSFRLFFRKENGQNIGLDDDDRLDEVVGDQPGQILVECPTLGILSGKIWLHKNFNEEVHILLGSPKRFEHFNVYRSEGSNYEVPLAKLDFIWAHNKVAIVEQETKHDYLTFQYNIENGWKLVVCKNDKVNPGDPSWTLKRIQANGKEVVLEGKRKIYFDSKSKNPKKY